MRGLSVLLAYSIRRVRALLAAMGMLLAIFQVFLIVVATSIHKSQSFEQIGALIPPFLREMMGPSFAAFMSFSGVVCLGYFHLSVMGSLVGLSIALATTPASEIETGIMDLILSRPLARYWVVARSIIMAIGATVFMLALMMMGTWAGLYLLAPPGAEWPRPRLILELASNLGLLMLGWSGIAMTIGAASRRRSVAAALAGLLALGTFLLDYVARAWHPAESVAWLSPFRYYSPLDLVMGDPLPGKNVLVLGAIAVTGFVLAVILFSRRDISH